MENTGNKYRTLQAVTAGLFLIAIAAAILVWGLTDLGITAVIGVFILILGIAFTAISFGYSGEPDKFGPSEKMFRLVAGLLMIIVGIICFIIAAGADWYVSVAVLLIGVAVIGICTALSNSKNTKY